MALSKEAQPNYQRLADMAVANHAAELSMPISHVGEHIEAAHIDIAGGEDPWETNYLGASYVQRLTPEPAHRRAARKPGEFSQSFEPKHTVTPFKSAEEIEKAKNKLKIIWRAQGVGKSDREKQLKRFELCCGEGTIGREVLDTIKAVESALKPRPFGSQATGED
ncbi:MAG TPA: hypothetical protein VFA93_01535 [Patescibacteria group bacterium]|nr:hypothetical protein [Patescibacteria group bacterium]